jgi:hypothetical protein
MAFKHINNGQKGPGGQKSTDLRRRMMRNVRRFSKWSFIMMAMVVWTVIMGFSTYSQGQSTAVEPRADQLLRKMSNYLGGIQQFSVQTENTLEIILRTGEKIQYDNPAEGLIRRPNKLRFDRKGDLVNQEFYYDGKTLTLYDKDRNCYATVGAPSTIDELIDFAREYLDLYVPGGDLLYKNAYEILMEDVISGFYEGMSVVGGIKCHHLAFRGNEVDWQIWIEDGDKPLPKKFIVTTKWMTGAPQFTMMIKSWNFSPKVTEDLFTFLPPKDAQKIEFIRLTK